MTTEILEAITSLKTSFETRLASVEEALKPATPVVETVKDEDILEIAEALAASTLSPVGRKRVLDLHRANKTPLAELIEAEEAYVKVASPAAETEGIEEVEESAKEDKQFKLPTRWTVKKDN